MNEQNIKKLPKKSLGFWDYFYDISMATTVNAGIALLTSIIAGVQYIQPVCWFMLAYTIFMLLINLGWFISDKPLPVTKEKTPIVYDILIKKHGSITNSIKNNIVNNYCNILAWFFVIIFIKNISFIHTVVTNIGL